MLRALLVGWICLGTLAAAEYDFALAPAGSRRWDVELDASAAITIQVRKSSGDLRLTLNVPGATSREVYFPRYSTAPIELVVTTANAARVAIVAANSAPAGPGATECAGRLILSDPRPATELDRKRWSAAQKMAASQALERNPAAASKVRNSWQEAIAELNALGDRYNLASAHRLLAGWLARQQDFRAARSEYLLALEALAGSGWRFEEAVVRQNLASVYSQTGDHVLAMEEQRAVLAIRKELNDEPGRAITLFGLGVTAWRMGAYQDAIEYYRQALTAWRNLGDRGWQAQVLNAMGLLDVSLTRYRSARTRYREANAIWLSLKDERSRAMALSNEGLLSAVEGDSVRARELLGEALAIYEKAQDRLSRAYVLQNLADVAANAGDHTKALELYSQSLQVKDQLGDAKGAASARTRSALSWLALKQHDKATEELTTALGIARRISGREEEAQALGALARVSLQTGDYAEAERQVTDAIRLIESTRLELKTRDARAGYFSSRRDYYDLAIDIAVANEKAALEHAWIWSERARSRTLLDTLNRAGLDTARSPDTIASFERLRGEIVRPGVVLVQYSVSPERTLAWIVDEKTARLVRLPGSNALAQALREAESGRLQEIGDAIWKPLKVRRAYRTVIVAPEGGLERIPFAALPVGSGVVLVDRCEVVNVSSVSLLLARRQMPGSSRGVSAVFADPVFSAADVRVPAHANGGESGSLARLRFTREEATLIAKLVGGSAEVALDFDATRDRLRSAASSPGPLLHIASHAVVEEDEPSRSRIVLSCVTPSAARLKGELTLDEIFSMPVRKDLVVLSACQTAEGAEIRGEGVMSFARAFLYSGAKALIATLYPVSDRTSLEFIDRFYNAMFVRRESASAALRRAQLEMKADPRWRDPRIWAAFVLFGDGGIRLGR